MSDDATFIAWFAERIGKPQSKFTKSDWQDAALNASAFIERAMPPSKSRGRPRRTFPLSSLLEICEPKVSRGKGRPRAQYGRKGLTIEHIANLVDEFTSRAVKKKFPNDAPRSDIAAIRMILKSIGHPVSYADAVARAVRRERKSRTKIVKK